MKLWAMPCRATQDGRIMVESSDKMDPLEKGMTNHFSILALRTPWTVWKGKQIGHWKINSPGRWSEVAQSCLTLCNPIDCSLPDYSVHGIFQGRVLEWVAICFSRGSSPPRNQTRISCLVGRRFTVWAIRLVGAQYATGYQWRNNSTNNEGMEPNKNNTQLWMGLVK